ncbi:MAG: S41 family peptidase [Rhodobiaceae bacterium]|jgi:carboxyl-terminal processing protease|nr:S41 family peptidase [Rhodobiaceae bacterium]
MIMICFGLGPQCVVANETPDLTGIWSTDGYGTVLAITNGSAQVMALGASYCVPETEAPVPLADLFAEAEFDLTPDGQVLTIGFEREPHRIRAHRLAARPAPCDMTNEDTPLAVFDIAVDLLSARYPFFALYDVDWPTHVATLRAEIHPDMRPETLFELLSRLLRPLRDGHLSLVAETEGARQVFSSNPGRIVETLRHAARKAGTPVDQAVAGFRRALWHDSIQRDLLGGDGQMIGNGRIQYGLIAEGVGYIAFLTIGGFGSDTADTAREQAETRRLLDLILADFAQAGVTSLILDLSLNFGGDDYVAREIAHRFIRRPTHAYTKYAGDAVAPIITRLVIRPSDGARFEGDVIVMTSNVTISAGEVLTLSLRMQPHVTHVGEATRGALSDVLSLRLPNGWRLNLSNEVYLDAAGRHWEAVGIPPDIEVPVFDAKDPIASHRSAVLRFARELSGN